MPGTEPIPSQESGGEQESEIQPVKDLTEFQTEIGRLKQEEVKERKTVHFRDLNPEDLTEEDMASYNKFLAKDWNRKEFEIYRYNIMEDLKKEPENSQLESRAYFTAYLGNMWQYHVTRQQLKELKGEQ